VITGFNDKIVFDITGASAFTALGSGALGTTTYTGAIAGGYLTYSGGVLSYDADGSAGSTFSPLANHHVDRNSHPILSRHQRAVPGASELKQAFPVLFLRLAIIAGNVLNFFCSAPAGNDLVVVVSDVAYRKNRV